MALQFIDGFDAGDLLLKGWASYNNPATSAGGPYGTGRSLTINNSVTYAQRQIQPASQVFIGFAYLSAGSPSSSPSVILTVYGDSGATTHMQLRRVSGGIDIARNGTSVASYSTSALDQNAWHYLEFTATISDTGGVCQVCLDGVKVIDYTGDTRNGGTATTIDTFRFTGPGGGPSTSYMDDLYVADSTGTTCNTFLGVCRVQSLAPTGAGSSTGFTPSTGTNYSCVGEMPYSASKYVTAAATGVKDTYATPGLVGAPSTIYAAQMNVIGKKTDSGAINIQTVVKSGTAVSVGAATAPALSDSTYSTLLPTDPATSATWTAAAVNAAEIGMQTA